MERRRRPKLTTGETHKISTGCGNMYVIVNSDGGVVIELFSFLGKAGSCVKAQLEAMTRSISLGLKYGIPVEEYIEEFKDIKCPYPSWDSGEQVLSCADAIAKVVRNAYRNNKPD